MTDSNQSRLLNPLNLLYETLGNVVVPNSCDIIVLAGRLDVRTLGRAITRALRRHPPLMSQFVSERGGVAWRQPPEELPIDIRVHEFDHDDSAIIDRHLVSNIWSTPLPRHERPIRFHVTETPERTYLQTIHTHIFADATSCYRLTEDIAESYAAYIEDRPYDDTPVDVPYRDIDSLFTSKLTSRERRHWQARGALHLMRDLAVRTGGLALPERPIGPRALTRAVLDADRTARLLCAARRHRCSIHAFFKLAFLRAGEAFNRARGHETRSLRAWDFFSLRPMAEPHARALYDCLAVVYPVDMQTDWSDEVALERFTAEIHAMRDGEVLAHAYRLANLYRCVGPVLPENWFYGAWQRIFKSNVFLTNPGIVPTRLDHIGGVPVHDYVTFPQLFAPARVMFVFSTFRDELRILALHDESAFDGDFEAALFHPFLRQLEHVSQVDMPDEALTGFMSGWTDALLARRDSASRSVPTMDSPGPLGHDYIAKTG